MVKFIARKRWKFVFMFTKTIPFIYWKFSIFSYFPITFIARRLFFFPSRMMEFVVSLTLDTCKSLLIFLVVISGHWWCMSMFPFLIVRTDFTTRKSACFSSKTKAFVVKVVHSPHICAPIFKAMSTVIVFFHENERIILAFALPFARILNHM